MSKLETYQIKNKDGIRDCLFMGNHYRYVLNIPSKNGIGHIYINKLNIGMRFKNKDKFYIL